MNIKAILKEHSLWLSNTSKGSRADLQGANLRRANLPGADLLGANLCVANLHEANLRGADLQGADLLGTNLHEANLHEANLQGANLREANLQGANLQGANLRANLREANLHGADLRGANLHGANLRGADLQGALLPSFQICPEVGGFYAWKKFDYNIVCKIYIPAKAKRTSSLVGRKCRASVIQIKEYYQKVPHGEGLQKISPHRLPSYITSTNARAVYPIDRKFHYPDMYDDDIRVECTHGIHFFMTKQEAIDW